MAMGNVQVGGRWRQNDLVSRYMSPTTEKCRRNVWHSEPNWEPRAGTFQPIPLHPRPELGTGPTSS